MGKEMIWALVWLVPIKGRCLDSIPVNCTGISLEMTDWSDPSPVPFPMSQKHNIWKGALYKVHE